MVFPEIISFLFAVSIIFYSCTNKDGNPEEIKFEKITGRNIFGAEIGDIDKSDWRFDDEWTDTEKELFTDTIYTEDCDTNVYYRILAYPNPFKKLMVINFFKDERTLIKMGLFDLQENLVFKYRIVDEDFRVISAVDSVINNQSHVNFRELLPERIYNNDSMSLSKKTPADSIFRVYYKLIDTDNECIYRGHGDIIMKK